MPAPRLWERTEIRCDWACAHPVLTAEEIEVGLRWATARAAAVGQYAPGVLPSPHRGGWGCMW
eukprot:7347587-Prymnesium_polylepis.1